MNSLFGTNGIRWVVSSHNINFPVQLGLVAGTYFGEGSKIALGMDTRTSSPMIFNAIISSLEATGCNVYDLGIVPTPLVQYAVREMKLDGGLIVTASHNPPEFNGIKFIASDGTEFSKEQESHINNIYNSNSQVKTPWNKVGKHYCERHIQSIYRKSIISKVSLLNSVSSVIDCGNGAAWDYTPEILTKLGCGIITLNAQPDGRFPGRLPEPTKENIGSLMMTVKQHGSDIGIAHDGDADRATFVDDKGNFVTGDQSLAIFTLSILKEVGAGKVVVPVNTSKTVLDTIEANNGEPVITAVGSPLIARTMIENGAVLGGEGNGGVIFPKHQYCRDGMMTAAKMVEIISHQGSFSDLVDQLPEYFLKRDKIKIPIGMKNKIIQKVKEDANGQVLDIDGIKIVNEDNWALVRPSGTEPILRVTVESQSEEKSKQLLQDNMNWVNEIIQSLT